MPNYQFQTLNSDFELNFEGGCEKKNNLTVCMPELHFLTWEAVICSKFALKASENPFRRSYIEKSIKILAES